MTNTEMNIAANTAAEKGIEHKGFAYVVMTSTDHEDIYDRDFDGPRVLAVCDSLEAARVLFKREWASIKSETDDESRTFEDECTDDDSAKCSARREVYCDGEFEAAYSVWVSEQDLFTLA